MRYRKRSPLVEPHFWSEDNPHPAQERSELDDGVVIRVAGGETRRRRYLKPGDVILPTSLPTVFEVMTSPMFHAGWEPVEPLGAVNDTINAKDTTHG